MSMATLENAILAAAKRHFRNPKLRKKDLMEWSTGEIETQDGEVKAWLDDPGVWVAISRELDRSGITPDSAPATPCS